MTLAFPFDLVMFDLDGTLIETAPEIFDAVSDTLARFDLPAVTQKQVDDWIGHGTRELLIQALAFTDKTDQAAVRASDSLKLIEAEFVANYQKRCGTRSTLYPHVRETLQALRQAGVKLAVVTNKEGQYTQTVLKAHGLQDAFDRVISGDSMPTKKPKPNGIWACIDQFGVALDHCLFVGDSSIDIATAKNAGVQVWALPYGYNMGAKIEDSHPDRIIADCSVIFNLIKR
jgi:phosphoglycolate phosphatase